MVTVHDFFNQRKRYQSEYMASPANKGTVLISSYIWWTELMAFALLRLGYNVLIAQPWYYFWTEDQHFANFDAYWAQWLGAIKQFKVQLVIGGNTTIMVPHIRTRELLHRTAGVPAVNFWWDESRAAPPMVRLRGYTLEDYVAAIRDDRTLNVFWDKDVAEEWQRFMGLTNLTHIPLGTTPEFWASPNAPLATRPRKVCFLGNRHNEGDWLGRRDTPLVRWAEQVANRKVADLDRSMVECVEAAGSPRASEAEPYQPYAAAATLQEEFDRWDMVGSILVSRLRNTIVQAAATRLGKDLVLIGKGWDQLGLTAQQDHSGIPSAKDYYATSQASLNLFGGSAHGGMPLRPYEIACSHGLLFTQYNRELPELFEPGKECIAFRNADEMLGSLEKILAQPQEFDSVVAAGHKRASSEHSWEDRMKRVLAAAKERFNLPWT